MWKNIFWERKKKEYIIFCWENKERDREERKRKEQIEMKERKKGRKSVVLLLSDKDVRPP